MREIAEEYLANVNKPEWESLSSYERRRKTSILCSAFIKFEDMCKEQYRDEASVEAWQDGFDEGFAVAKDQFKEGKCPS